MAGINKEYLKYHKLFRKRNKNIIYKNIGIKRKFLLED